jgi:hypothetical protein
VLAVGGIDDAPVGNLAGAGLLQHLVADQVEDGHDTAGGTAGVEAGGGLAVRPQGESERPAVLLDDITDRRDELVVVRQIRAIGLLAGELLTQGRVTEYEPTSANTVISGANLIKRTACGLLIVIACG